MNREHYPIGHEDWLVMSDNYSKVKARCACGGWLVRETAPVGAPYNWQDWQHDSEVTA